MDFVVGKKYTNELTGKISECIFVTPKGIPVMVFPDGSEGLCPYVSPWVEYKEPVRHVRYIHWWRCKDSKDVIITYGDNKDITVGSKYYDFIKTDTVEFIDEVTSEGACS